MGRFSNQFLGDEPASPTSEVSEEKELLTEVPEPTAPLLSEEPKKKKVVRKRIN